MSGMESSALTEPTVAYKDKYIRLFACIIGAHVFTVYGEPESSLEWLLKRDYYPAFLISLLIAFAVTAYIRWINRKLDRKYDWQHHTTSRLLLQPLLGLLLPALLAFGFTWFYLRMRGVNILATSYVTHDFQFLLLMLAVVNAYYITYFFYVRWQNAERMLTRTMIPTDNPTGYFVVSQGTKTVPVELTAIACIYRDDDANYLITFDQERFFIPGTLDDAMQKLDKNFFRVNRQLIIARKTLVSYKNIEFGKMQLTLSIDVPDDRVVSQKRAKSFKDWAR